MGDYSLAVLVNSEYEQAIEEVGEALAEFGFGILSRIDVAATLKAKLGTEIDPYIILGACNPPFAHQALEADPDIGLLLPCNVTVRATDQGTQVSAIDPAALVKLAGEPMELLADEVKRRLSAALEKLPGARPVTATAED